MRWFRWSMCAAAIGVGGCGWVSRSSQYERDPFVMSHLTHSKEDPMFAATDGDHHVSVDTEPSRSASLTHNSRRPSRSNNDSSHSAFRHVSHSAADEQYRQLNGTLGYRTGKYGGWYIRYAGKGSGDPYGGEIVFANSPRMGLLREGDQIRVEGRVVHHGSGEPRYHVDSISLLAE